MMITQTFTTDEFIPQYAAVSVNTLGRVINTDWPDSVSTSNHIGIAMNDAGMGATVTVCLFGIITNPGWSFDRLMPVYAFYTGGLTQKVLNQSVLKIGKALTPSTLYVYPSDFMMLA